MGLIQERALVMPKLEFPESLKRDLANLLRNAILTNIRDGVQADGSPIKPNSQRYADYKARKGWAVGGVVRSLVAGEHRFVRPELWSAEWDGDGLRCKLEIEPSSSEDTAEISLEVQLKGYTGWFAPRPEAIQAALQLVRDWIREEIGRSVKRGMGGV